MFKPLLLFPILLSIGIGIARYDPSIPRDPIDPSDVLLNELNGAFNCTTTLWFDCSEPSLFEWGCAYCRTSFEPPGCDGQDCDDTWYQEYWSSWGRCIDQTGIPTADCCESVSWTICEAEYACIPVPFANTKCQQSGTPKYCDPNVWQLSSCYQCVNHYAINFIDIQYSDECLIECPTPVPSPTAAPTPTCP